MDINLPGKKIRNIRQDTRKILSHPSPSARSLSQLVSKLNATTPAFQMAPLFCRSLQTCLKQVHSQNYQSPIQPSTQAIEVVGTVPIHMEWKELDHTSSLYDNNLRLITPRLGGHLQWSTDRRSMVSSGANSSHQLFGTPGSLISSADFHQAEIRHHNSPGTRQHYCSRLHQQNGGDNITYAIASNQGSVVMVHGKKYHATAHHLSGVLNSIADRESRTWSDRSEWRLSLALFQRINLQLGPLSTDLFTSRLSAQLPVFTSRKPDPLAIATDAFTIDWSSIPAKPYANPPRNLVGRVLSQTLNQKVELVLVAPVWKAQSWYPPLLQMLVREPLNFSKVSEWQLTKISIC